MEGIIKLHAKVNGIAPVDQSTVKIRLGISKCEQRVKKNVPYEVLNNKQAASLINKEISLNYQGPVRLGNIDNDEFAFTNENVHHLYGTGANISDLFVDDEVEVYIRWQTFTDASDNMHFVVKNTIITQLTPQPTELIQILPKLVLPQN